MVSFLARQRSSSATAASIKSCSAIHALRNSFSSSFLPWQPHGRGREGRHAFAAPDESELLAGRRLHGHAGEVYSGDFGDALAHGVAMRADAGRFADHVDVEMGDAAAARAHPLDRKGEETVGGNPAPLRIA